MATARASSSSIEPHTNATQRVLIAGRLSPRGRVLAFVIALLSATPLVIAAFLRPSAAGHGTHLQLGLPPCGWVAFFHHPCPTCGMTTAFTHAVHGDPLSAFRAQPFGLLLCVLAGVTFWVALYACLTGAAVHRALAPLFGARTLWTLLALALLAWGYKWATWPA